MNGAGRKPPGRRRAGGARALLLGAVLAAGPGAAGGDDFPADPAVLEAFLDGAVATAMDQRHLPGAAVAVVHGDRLLLARGWGLAEVATDRPVDPDRTLFRIASVSKTLTFTALMQLAAQGRVALDQDLRGTLREVPVEERYGPLTPWHLMTHTAGFEDLYLGHFLARDAGGDPPLADYLARWAPRRVRPPGEMTSYSNYGAALAGQLVAEAAGVTFEDHMERAVLTPLGMTGTTFREHYDHGGARHMPAGLAARRAHPYRWADGAFRELPTYHMHRGLAPAGGAWSTATDMARWMIAHLNGGANDHGRVLAPETTRRMHEVAFRNHPGMAGNAHGFWASETSGYPTLEHGGALFGFYANLVLVPELKLGLFVATNGNAGRPFVTSLPDRVVRRFFTPRRAIPEAAPPDFDRSARAYLGDYLVNRRGYSTMDKLLSAGRATVRVSTDRDGFLLTDDGEKTERWVALGDDRFASTETGRPIAFRLGPDGRATHLFDSYGHESATRVAWPFTDRFLFGALVAGAVTALAVVAGFALRRERPPPRAWLVPAAALAWLAFIAVLAFYRVHLGGPLPGPLFAFPDAGARALNWIGALAVALTAAGIVSLAAGGAARDSARLGQAAALLVFCALAWSLWDWRAIGFHYP